jgi:hypothetical protein
MLNTQIKSVHEELKSTPGVGIIRKKQQGGEYEYVLITTPKHNNSAKVYAQLRDDKLRIERNEKQLRDVIKSRQLDV